MFMCSNAAPLSSTNAKAPFELCHALSCTEAANLPTNKYINREDEGREKKQCVGMHYIFRLCCKIYANINLQLGVRQACFISLGQQARGSKEWREQWER